MNAPKFSSTVILIAGCTPLAAQDYIDSYTVDGGGGSSSGGGYTLHGTIGQTDASGPLSGGALELTGGFWHAAVVAPLTGFAAWMQQHMAPGVDTSFNGDANGDGLANGLDYVFGPAGIQAIGAGVLTGPSDPVPDDVDLVLEASTNLVTSSWVMLLRYEAGVLTFIDPDISIGFGAVSDATDLPTRFYRYRADQNP